MSNAYGCQGSPGGAPRPLAIAHRGGAGLAAENTLSAFQRSYDLGLRYLETDVRHTADGHLVAFHDALLNRVTTASGRLRLRTLDEITSFGVLGSGPVIGLAPLLAAFPSACFTLDIKHPAVIRPLAELLTRTGAVERVCVAAARGRWLRAIRDLVGPQLVTALPWRDLVRLAGSSRAVSSGYDGAAFAHVPMRLGRVPVFRNDLVARAHDAGLRLVVWTVNDPATMNRLLDAGADGIITDRPDLLREVLIARGQWQPPDTWAASEAVSDAVP